MGSAALDTFHIEPLVHPQAAPFPDPANPSSHAEHVPPSWLRINPLTNTAGIAATQVLDHNRNRVQWLIVNLGLNTSFVGFDDSVSASRGIPIGATGGSAASLFREDGALTFMPVWVISPSGAGGIYVVETVADDIGQFLKELVGGV